MRRRFIPIRRATGCCGPRMRSPGSGHGLESGYVGRSALGQLVAVTYTRTVFCAHCGGQVWPDENFCPRCGTPAGSGHQHPTGPVPNVGARRQTADLTWIVAAVVAVIVVAGAGAAF